jgi:hypothetical protein
MTINMQNNMQNMQKICQKYANPFSICRILTCLYSAYFAYKYTPHFADAGSDGTSKATGRARAARLPVASGVT